MIGYDPHAALAAIDENAAIILAYFAGAALFTFIFLIESFRLAIKHVAYSAPLAAVGWFAMHDLHFVLLYDRWFNEFDHWWPQVWWVALVFTTVIEFALVGMVIKYGREELLPHASQTVFAASVVAITLAIGLIWLMVKSTMVDDLFLVSFPITAFWALPFSTALAVKRQSRKGQSVLLEVCVIFIMLSFQGALWTVDPFFRSPLYITFTAMAVFWGLGNIWLLRSFPEYLPPDVASARDRLAVAATLSSETG